MCDGIIAHSDAELTALNGCTEVNGDVIAEGAAVTTFESMAAVARITGLLRITSTDAGRLELPALREVTGAVLLTNNAFSDCDVDVLNRQLRRDVVPRANSCTCDLPGSVNVETDVPPGVPAHIRGNLRITADVDLSGLSAVTDVDGCVIVGGSAVSVALPLLARAERLQVDDAPDLVSLTLPALTTVLRTVEIRNSGLADLAGLSSLRCIRDDLQIVENEALTQIGAFAQLDVTTVVVSANANLSNVSGVGLARLGSHPRHLGQRIARIARRPREPGGARLHPNQ